MSSRLADLAMYARFGSGLPGFLRRTIDLETARAILGDRLASRSENFLHVLKRGVFDNPQSPYLPLLCHAGCELADIERSVEVDGLEQTARALRGAGVYFTFEQFKGREPVARDGLDFRVEPEDFTNPSLSGYYSSETGGSTGAGNRIDTDLDFIAAQVPHHVVAQQAHGVLDSPRIIWRPVLPSGSGINNMLRSAHMGRVPLRWFTPVVKDDIRPAFKYHVATQATVAIGRATGVPLPWPEAVRLDEAGRVARTVVEVVEAHGSCLVMVPVSCALRTALAALEDGLGLEGATFMIAGEPATPAKVSPILEAGARFFTTYGMAESGRIGMGCAAPRDAGDLHFLEDAFVLTTFPRAVEGFEGTIDTFYLTSLLPSASKILLNVEMDDYGIVEERRCGCPLGELGYGKHLRRIQSFCKLSGEGTTLVGSEMVRILEEVLPARFGGSPLDYQLLEEEDQRGFTRLSIVIDPKVDIDAESAVIETVLAELGRGSVAADLSRAIWRDAGTLRVRRSPPVWTAHAKLLPLRVERARSA